MTSRKGLLAGLAWAMLMVSPALAQETATLELSLDQAVERALENNVDIAIERFSPESSAQSVREAVGGAYDPVFQSTVQRISTTQPASNVFSGAEKVDTDRTVFDFRLNQYVPTGATLSLDFTNYKNDTNNIFSTFNPEYNSNLTFQAVQPLLSGLKTDNRRYQIRVAKKNQEISDVQFRQSVINTIANVKRRYYDLIYYIDNLSVQNKSLALAQKLLDENQIRVKVGTMAPLDVVSAEAEVARLQEQVILAETSLAQAEDDLKTFIFPGHDMDMWATRLVPTDRPTAERFEIDLEGAIAKALEQRTDVLASRKNLEIADQTVELYRSGRLPALDLILSYGANGQGGTQLIREDPPFSPIVDQIEGGYGDALSSVLKRDYPTWSAGVNLTFPIPNRSARATEARARIARDQALTRHRALELRVASEVRSAGRAVESGFQRVESTKAARVLAERRLDAEEKKFAAGMSTNFLVTQAQRDLALQEALELQAVADYHKSIIAYEQVQEASSVGISFASALGARITDAGSRTPTTGGSQ